MAHCTAMAGLLVTCAFLALAISASGQPDIAASDIAAADIAAAGIPAAGIPASDVAAADVAATFFPFPCPPGLARNVNGFCVPAYDPTIRFSATMFAVVNNREVAVHTVTLADFPFVASTGFTPRGITLPRGANTFRVAFTVDATSANPRATGVKCLSTTDAALLRRAGDPVFYSAPTSACYQCFVPVSSSPFVVSGASTYANQGCLAGCPATQPGYSVGLSRTFGLQRPSSLIIGTAWMRTTLGVAPFFSPPFPFPLCLQTFAGVPGFNWVPLFSDPRG